MKKRILIIDDEARQGRVRMIWVSGGSRSQTRFTAG